MSNPTGNSNPHAGSESTANSGRIHMSRATDMSWPERVKAPPQTRMMSRFKQPQLPVKPFKRTTPTVGSTLPQHPNVQMNRMLNMSRSAHNPTLNRMMDKIAAKHVEAVQRAQAEGEQAEAKQGPITYTLVETAKGRYNNTGLTFRHEAGKPLTAEEVYRFIRDEKAAGNTELQELLPMRAATWYQERGQEPPRITIENSAHTFYGYAGNGKELAEAGKEAEESISGPTLSILNWPRAPDYQKIGSPAGTDNRNSYQMVQGYYVLTQTTSSGDRYFYLHTSEKGQPGAEWTAFTPKGLTAKQARDADPMGYAYMRGMAGSWTDLVEADYNEIGHSTLDYIGMVPILGEGADIINAIWYAAEGKYLDAFLSSGAAVPLAGYAFNVIKKGRLVQKIYNRGGKMVVETVADKADEVVEQVVKSGDEIAEEASKKLGKEVDAPKVKQDAPDTKTPKDADSPHAKPETQTPKEYSEGEMDKLKKQDEHSHIDKETKQTDPNYASKQQARLLATNILTTGDNANQHPATLMPALWALTVYKGVRGFSFLPTGADKFQFYLHGSKEEMNPQDGVYDVKGEEKNGPEKNAYYGQKLKEDLSIEEKASLFDAQGKVKPEVIQQSVPIIPAKNLGNDELKQKLKSIGGSIEDWNKMSYPIRGSKGIDVHFYYNAKIDQLYLDWDYKSKLGSDFYKTVPNPKE